MGIQAGVVGWRRAHTDIMGELSSSAYIYHCIGDNYLEQSVSHMFGASGVFVGPGCLQYCSLFFALARGDIREHFFLSLFLTHTCIYIHILKTHIYTRKTTRKCRAMFYMAATLTVKCWPPGKVQDIRSDM